MQYTERILANTRLHQLCLPTRPQFVVNNEYKMTARIQTYKKPAAGAKVNVGSWQTGVKQSVLSRTHCKQQGPSGETHFADT